MISWLRHLLDPAYLYAQNSRPLGRWGVPQILWASMLLVILALAWRRMRRAERAGQPALAARITAWSSLAGLILLVLHVHSVGALSARIWYLSASALALATPLGHWLLLRRWPPQAYLLGRALAARLAPDDPPLPWTWQAALGLMHLSGLCLVLRQGVSLPIGPALIALLLAGWAQTRCGGKAWHGLRLEVLTPFVFLYAAALLRLLLGEGLGIRLEAYQAFPYPDPWSPWSDLSVVGVASSVWVLISAGAFVGRCVGPFLRALLGPRMLVLGLGWYVATMAIHLSHGASGSDPFCYLQMAVDLAQRGTALHDFPLAALAREAHVAVWPTVHVGYHPPVKGTLAPTVWPIGWPLILAPFYWLGGEVALLWAAPLCMLFSALLTWKLVCALWPSEDRGEAGLVGDLAALIALTSYEGLLRSLVPMADAAAQMLTVLTLLCLVLARRQGTLLWAALAGASWGLTYFVRHAQLPLGLAALPAFWGAPWPWRRRLGRLGAFSLAALACALPDLWYHQRVFGSPWASESPEWFLLSWRNVRPVFLSLLRDGFLRREEFGYLLPFVLYGAWRQWRDPAERPWAAIIGLGFGSVLLFHLFYGALRLRDLIPLFPILALWAGRGIEALWERAAQSYASPCTRRTLVLTLALMTLAARTAGTLRAPWRPRLWTFGYVSAVERAGYERLRDVLPPNAVIGTGLNSGAVERYTGRPAVRPASWTNGEFARFWEALRARGRTLYLLDDGEEMEAFLSRLAGDHPLRYLGDFTLPTFGLGGQDYGRPAKLYALE